MFSGGPYRNAIRSVFARAALTALLLTLCGGNGRAEDAGSRRNTWTTPHVLTISDAGDVDTLNPHLSNVAPVANLSEMTMAWLLRWDEHNQLYPELATDVPTLDNGGISRDGLTITYHLRRGVKWSDGAPFDADDVVFSTKVVNDPANKETGRFDQLAGVDEPDKFTVVFHLKKPFAAAAAAFFSSCCANPCLLPKHLLAQYPTINNAPYNALPVGIGPFAFERWDRAKDVVLTANPLYWRGRPKLNSVVYKIVSGRDALLQELQSHRVDMWYQFSGAYLPRIQAIPGYDVYRQPSYAYSHFDFNLTRKAVSELVVREALRLGFQPAATRRYGRARRWDRARFSDPGGCAVFRRSGRHGIRSGQSKRALGSGGLVARSRRCSFKGRRSAETRRCRQERSTRHRRANRIRPTRLEADWRRARRALLSFGEDVR